MSERCDREGCPEPTQLSHYHCGHCTSPKITSMYGHYIGGEMRCNPVDVPYTLEQAERDLDIARDNLANVPYGEDGTDEQAAYIVALKKRNAAKKFLHQSLYTPASDQTPAQQETVSSAINYLLTHTSGRGYRAASLLRDVLRERGIS